MTVRTAYPHRTLRLWTSGDQPVLHVWLGYTSVDAEQKSNRTFIVLCVRRPKIPGLLELACGAVTGHTPFPAIEFGAGPSTLPLPAWI